MPNNLETQLESLYSKSLAAIDRFASDPSQDTSIDEVNFRLRNFFGLYELVRMTVAPNGSTKHSPTRLSFWVAHRHRAFIASIPGRAVGMDPRLSPLQRLTAISQPSYDSPMRLISGRYAELRSRALAEAVESKGGGAWLLGSLKDPQARIEAFDSLTLSGHEPLIELQQARLREQVSSAQNAGDDTTNRQPRCHSALNHKSEVNKLLYSSYPQDSRAAAHAFDTLRSGLGMHFIPSPRADADALALRMLAQHQRNYSGSDAKDLLSSFESILQVALDACAGTVASMEFDGRFARARVTSPTYGFSGEIYLIQSPHAHTPRTFEVRPPWRSPGVAAICIPSKVGETRELSGLLFHELGHAIDHISRTGDSPLDCGLDPESDLIEVPPKLFEALHQESAGPFHPNPGENSEIEDLISIIDRHRRNALSRLIWRLFETGGDWSAIQGVFAEHGAREGNGAIPASASALAGIREIQSYGPRQYAYALAERYVSLQLRDASNSAHGSINNWLHRRKRARNMDCSGFDLRQLLESLHGAESFR